MCLPITKQAAATEVRITAPTMASKIDHSVMVSLVVREAEIPLRSADVTSGIGKKAAEDYDEGPYENRNSSTHAGVFQLCSLSELM